MKLYENPRYGNAGLVISRQKDERIFIIPKREPNYMDKSVVITVIDVRGDKVRLGINGNINDYLVHGKEILEAIENSGQLEKELELTDGAGI